MVLTRVFGIIFMHTHTQREFYCIIKHDKNCNRTITIRNPEMGSTYANPVNGQEQKFLERYGYDMSEHKMTESKEWQQEVAHLKECRTLIAANIAEYEQQYEERHKETRCCLMRCRAVMWSFMTR